MLDRLPARSRAALLAGLAALAALSAGGWALREYQYDAQYEATKQAAVIQSRAVARSLALSRDVVRQSETQQAWPYAIEKDGTGVASWGSTLLGYELNSQFPPAPQGAGPEWTTTRTVRLAPLMTESLRQDGIAPPMPDRAPGQAAHPTPLVEYPSVPDRTRSSPGPGPALRPAPATYQAVATVVELGASERTMFGSGGRFTVYVLVLPDDAEATADALNLPLAIGIPAGVLLVALTGYVSTARALRPVDAIRAELDTISAHHLDRRVPVPPARDEISRLARSTNAALDRLERSTTQQARFVADASHELRSPITAIRTRLEIAEAHRATVDPYRTMAETLLATRRLQDLTEDLLFLTRPHTNPGHAALVDLAGIARELVEDRRTLHSHRLHVQAPDQAPVRGKAAELHRLVRNLLDNAVRHAATEVTVTVTVTVSPPEVRLTVFNDGPAVPAEDRERIFERFVRLDEARSRDEGGSGLGLAIAREIATRQQGTLTVVDTPSDTGTAFLLTLPRGDL